MPLMPVCVLIIAVVVISILNAEITFRKRFQVALPRFLSFRLKSDTILKKIFQQLHQLWFHSSLNKSNLSSTNDRKSFSFPILRSAKYFFLLLLKIFLPQIRAKLNSHFSRLDNLHENENNKEPKLPFLLEHNGTGEAAVGIVRKTPGATFNL